MTRTLPLCRTNHPHKRTVTVLIGIESRLLANPLGLPHADMARHARQVARVASERCPEALTGNARGEVERPTPSVLKEVGNQVIVEVVDVLVFALFALGAGGLVRPCQPRLLFGVAVCGIVADSRLRSV